MNHSLNTKTNRALAAQLRGGCAVSALLVLPNVLAHPAAAQTVISSNHYSTVNLSNYGAGLVSIAAGTTIDASGSGLFGAAGASWSLANAGIVASPGGEGIWLAGPGAVTNTGSVSGLNAIALDHGGTVNNSGQISASTYGIVVNSAAGTVTNSGQISAGDNGVSLNHGGSVANSGTIFGSHIGVYTGTGTGTVLNSGMISATTGDAVALYRGGALTNTAAGRLNGGYSGVFVGGHNGSVTNAGDITGTHFGIYVNTNSSVANTGTITGGADGIINVGTGGGVTNSGLISATGNGVRLGAHSSLDNAGTILGGMNGVTLGASSSLTNEVSGIINGDSFGLVAAANATINNAGLIEDSAVAGLSLASGGHVVNSGTITGVTGILAGGSLTSIFDTGTITGTGVNAIALSGADALTLGTGAVINGAIDGGGSASTIELTGTGSLASALNNFGTGSALAIDSGADWTATGTWDIATVTNNGTLAPGAAGNTLTIDGNFIQSATGDLVIAVSPSAASALVVNGAVTLGGKLDYVLAPGAYEPATETFLTATGGVSGAFSSVSPAQTTPHTSQQVTQPPTQPAPQQTTPQQVTPQQVTQQTVPQTTQPTTQPQQTTQPAAQQTVVTAPAAAPVAVTAPSAPSTTPVTYSITPASNAVAVSITSAFTVAPTGAAIYADANQDQVMELEHIDDTLLAHATAPGPGPCLPKAAMQAWTLPSANMAGAIADALCHAGGWAEAAGAETQTSNFRAHAAGFLGGLDRTLPSGTVLGITAGFGQDTIMDKSGDTARVDSVGAGLYGSQKFGALEISGDTLLAVTTTHIERQTGIGTATARASGLGFSAALQVARPFTAGTLTWIPAAGLKITNINTGAMTESAPLASFAVRAGASNSTSVKPYLSLAILRTLTTPSGVSITPNLDLELSSQVANPNTNVALTTQSGTSFSSTTPRLSPAAAQVSGGLTISQANISLSARYTIETAGTWTSQTAEAAVQVRF